MKNKYRILKIIVTVGLLSFLLSFSLNRFNNKTQKTEVNFVQPDPVYFVNEKTIESLVMKSNPNGKIKSLDIPALEKSLSEIPAVDSANVYLNLNGKLKVEVRQRIPVMRISTPKGKFYVDQKGVEFPLSKQFSYPCMLITGAVPKRNYKVLVSLIQKIDADPFFKKFFVGINLDPKGNYELLTDDGNYKVQLGDLTNQDFKLNGFKTFLEKYLINQNPKKYRMISVKYNNQVIATLRKGFSADDEEPDQDSIKLRP